MQRTPKTRAQPRLLIKVQNAPKKRHLRDESEKPLQKAVISHFVKNVLKTRSKRPFSQKVNNRLQTAVFSRIVKNVFKTVFLGPFPQSAPKTMHIPLYLRFS